MIGLLNSFENRISLRKKIFVLSVGKGQYPLNCVPLILPLVIRTDIKHYFTFHLSLYSLIKNCLDAGHSLDPVPEGRDPGVG